MKEQASQGVIKSTIFLENGGKIIQVRVSLVVQVGEFHEHGD